MSFSTNWIEQVEFDRIDATTLAPATRAKLDALERAVVHLRVNEIRGDGGAVISVSDGFGVYQTAVVGADGNISQRGRAPRH